MLKLVKGLFFIFLLSISSYVSAYPFYGPTVPSEHLYRIALRVRPTPTISVPQMMVAILRANPNAFAQNNINALKAGYRLQLPPLPMVLRVSPEEAVRIVNHQNREWNRASQEPKIAMAKNSTSKHAKAAEKEVLDAIPSIEGAKETDLKSAASNDNKSTLLELAKQQAPSTQAPITDPTPSPDQLQAIDTKINNMVESNKAMAQQTQTQLIALTEQTKQLATKVKQLNAQLHDVTYQVVQLTGRNAQDSTNYSKLLLTNLKHNSAGLCAGVLALVLLTYLLFRSFKPRARVARTGTKKEEYDYLDSQEGIPAKLDLARAYFEMGDYISAESALNDVLRDGNEEQRNGAQELLDKINSEK